MTGTDATDAPMFLIALEQCGLELQASHMRTRTKRRIETSDVDAATLPSDSLRFTGWDPEAMVASFPGLDPGARYELEATFLCERDVERVVSMNSRELQLHPPITLARGTATVVRVPVPPAAVADGTLEVRVERVAGPDVVMSELRLFSSEPPPPALTVVGDSRGGLIGTVGAPDYAGVPGAEVRVAAAAGTFEVRTDPAGVFRVPLQDGLPLGQHGELTIATGSGAQATGWPWTRATSLAGCASCRPSRTASISAVRGRSPADRSVATRSTSAAAATTRVPGHVIYDGLVPEDGVATFHRPFEVPASLGGQGRVPALRRRLWTSRGLCERIACRGARQRRDLVRRRYHAAPPAGRQ